LGGAAAGCNGGSLKVRVLRLTFIFQPEERRSA